jgi:hypothetical protein
MTTKIVELFIEDMEDESGIEAISLVGRPAHDETWLAFNHNEEVEKLEPQYKIMPEDFCSHNPLLKTIGEGYGDLINEGWEIVRVEKITPQIVHKMNQERFTRSKPNEESELDKETFRVRYKYVGPVDDRNRQFCSDMMSANRVYRIEDIDALSDSVANPEFGFYEIFTWRGSFNCRHQWVRLIYKKTGSIINSGDSSKGLIREEGLGPRIQRDTRNDATIRVGDTGTLANGKPASDEQVRRDRPAREGSSFAEIGPRGGVKESDKAPKSKTPNEDPKGEGTAKGDASGKRGAKVTAEQEKTLQKKVDDFNEKDSNTKNGRATLGALKSVFQRGLGAYNVSHSPEVSSSEQWAYARVNAFLYLLKNGRPDNKKYTTDYDLLPKDHPKYSMSVEEPEYFEDSINDYPESVKNAAARAVKYAEENGWGSCGTAVGKQRASQLSKGENISLETVERMYSYLSRHKVDLETSKSYEDGCGKLMYDAWGGESGLSWSERKLKQLVEEEMGKTEKLLFYDEDKRVIVGAAMVPNKMIIRYDSLGNPYHVFFSKKTIKKMADKFLRQRRTDETNIEHNGIKLGADKVYITESWVSEDPIKDKSAAYGFNLPSGTWYVSMKIEDPKVWKLVKDKMLTGFSVEGLFAEKSVFSKDAEIINTIKDILKSIKDE